jgi:hypothetical protein
MASASVSWIRGVWPGVPLVLAGVVGVHYWPAHAAPIFTAASIANIGVCVFVLARARRR